MRQTVDPNYILRVEIMTINKPRFVHFLRPPWNDSMLRLKGWDADQKFEIIGQHRPTSGNSRRKAPRHFG